MSAQRAFADAGLFLAAFLLPWWVVFIAGGALFFRFPHYAELLLAALALDLLYGAPTPRFGNFQFVFSAAALLLFAGLSALKQRMRL